MPAEHQLDSDLRPTAGTALDRELCTYCIGTFPHAHKAVMLTGDRIEYLAAQDAGDRFPQIPVEAYAQSIQLVRPDGSVSSGARAVFESLGKERIYPWISGPSEIAYRIVTNGDRAVRVRVRDAFAFLDAPAREMAPSTWTPTPESRDCNCRLSYVG